MLVKPLLSTIFLFFTLFSSVVFAVTNPNSPVGYWKTIDDVTGKPKGIVQLWETNNVIFGRIVKIFPSPGHDQNEVCSACVGDKHNQRIVGMTFLENLVPAAQQLQWENGTILDPKNGKVYHSQIRLIDNGQKLSVRGFIGMPLFGRSQTWIRVEDVV